MKELASVAYNVLVNLSEGKPRPAAEVALCTTEPNYRQVGNTVERRRDSYTVRFVAAPSQLRDLAKQLMDAADDVESVVAASLRTDHDEEPAPQVDPAFGTIYLTDGTLYWRVTANSVDAWCSVSGKWHPSEYRTTSDFPKDLLHRLTIVSASSLPMTMTV